MGQTLDKIVEVAARLSIRIMHMYPQEEILSRIEDKFPLSVRVEGTLHSEKEDYDFWIWYEGKDWKGKPFYYTEWVGDAPKKELASGVRMMDIILRNRERMLHYYAAAADLDIHHYHKYRLPDGSLKKEEISYPLPQLE